MNTIVIDLSPSVKTKAENETAFAHLQTLATQRMAEFEQAYGFPTSLTYEEVLATLMAVYTREGGYDFTGMVAREDFADWVAQMEADFDDIADAQLASRSGIPMF
jgi:predicted NACHT family NTPase